MAKADITALKLDNFISGDFGLDGKYPAVPPEVMRVFLGTWDGLIDKNDILGESLIIGEMVWDTWFSSLGNPYSALWLLYCLGYMTDKADDIHDIIDDTRIFQLPSVTVPSLNAPNFKLNKDGLDDIMKDLKKQLKNLWPEHEKEEDKEKHEAQTTDMSKLEKELKKVMDFVNNPTAPLTEEVNRVLAQLKEVQDAVLQFTEDLQEAAKRLKNLDLSALAKLNDSMFLEMTGTLDSSIKDCSDAMIGYYKKEMKGLIGTPENPPTLEDFQEMGRMRLCILSLKTLKANTKPMKDYVNNYIRKQDIAALSITIENQKHIEELGKISIQYDQDKSVSHFFDTRFGLLAMLSLKLWNTNLYAQKFCDCIRIFDKMKDIENGIKDLFLAGVIKYTKASFPDMTKAEQNMFSSCISGKTPSGQKGASKLGIDRLNTLASEIMTESKELIDITELSEATKIR